MLHEETEQKAADVQYKVYSAMGRITQHEGCEDRRQAHFGRIFKRAGRLMSGIEMLQDQLIECLQVNLQNYLNAVFAAV